MAYITEDLEKNAIEAIQKNRLIFIEDIIAYLPCSKSTFYEHFPNESNEYKKLFELLEKNRVELKVSMRSKWFKSNSPALQLGLMKILGTPEELKKLSMTYTDITTKDESLNKPVDPKEVMENITKVLNGGSIPES
jgi:hypothetical protein